MLGRSAGAAQLEGALSMPEGDTDATLDLPQPDGLPPHLVAPRAPDAGAGQAGLEGGMGLGSQPSKPVVGGDRDSRAGQRLAQVTSAAQPCVHPDPKSRDDAQPPAPSRPAKRLRSVVARPVAAADAACADLPAASSALTPLREAHALDKQDAPRASALSDARLGGLTEECQPCAGAVAPEPGPAADPVQTLSRAEGLEGTRAGTAGPPQRRRAADPRPWGGPGNAAVDAVLSRFRGRLSAAGAARSRGQPAAWPGSDANVVPDPNRAVAGSARATPAAGARRDMPRVGHRLGPLAGESAGEDVQAARAVSPAPPAHDAAEQVREQLPAPRLETDAPATEPQVREYVGGAAGAEGEGDRGGAKGALGAAPGKAPAVLSVRSVDAIRAGKARRPAAALAAADAGGMDAAGGTQGGGSQGDPTTRAPRQEPRQEAAVAAPRTGEAPGLRSSGAVAGRAPPPRRKHPPIVFTAPAKPAATASTIAQAPPVAASTAALGALLPKALSDAADAPQSTGKAGNGPAGDEAGRALDGAAKGAKAGASAQEHEPAHAAAGGPVHPQADGPSATADALTATASANGVASPAAPAVVDAAGGDAKLGLEGPAGGAGPQIGMGVPASAGSAKVVPHRGVRVDAAAAPSKPRKPVYDERYVKKELVVEAGGEKLEVC